MALRGREKTFASGDVSRSRTLCAGSSGRFRSGNAVSGVSAFKLDAKV